MKIKKIHVAMNLIYALTAIIVLIIVYISSLNPYEADVRLLTERVSNYSDDWKMLQDDGSYSEVSLPLFVEHQAGKTITITKKLDDMSYYGKYLLMRDVHCHVVISSGGVSLFDYGGKQSSIFPIPGCAWIMVPLHDSYAGQDITVSSTSFDKKYSGSIGKIYIGDRSAVFNYIISTNTLGIATCLMILFFSFIMFIGWIMTRKLFNNNNLLYLSLFEVAIFVWSSNEAQVTQFIIGNMQAVSTLTYEILILLPMPLLAYYEKSQYEEIRTICSQVAFIPVLNFAICNILHFTGIVYLNDSLVLTHFCILLASVFAVYGHLKAAKVHRKERSGRPPLSTAGFIFLIAMIAADIIRYYFTEHYGDSSLCSRIGLLVYVVSLGLETMQGGFSYLIMKRNAEMYRTLAYTDNLTGLANRQAYEEKINSIAGDKAATKRLVAAMIDLNNLKQTNDKFGHAAGDKYIMGSSNYVSRHFGNIAEVFRIGGDEFAVLFTGDDRAQFDKAEKNMMDGIGAEKSVEINFSYGSASFDPAVDSSPEDTLHRADEKMYDAKRKYKLGKESKDNR